MIYTFGYAGQSLEELAAWIEEHGAFLLDIRFYPFSRDRDWNGSNLQMMFSDLTYIPVHNLGNKKFREGGMELVNPREGLETVLYYANGIYREQDVVLMCACRDFERCHRRVVSELLFMTRGIRTQELKLKKA